jgi:hypothetical protein
MILGLIWRQWVAYGNVLLGVLSAYLVLGWVLPVFHHPGWILGGGAILALFLGVVLGGGDAAEGAEEFSFALPPMRGERYLTRLAFGGAILAAFLFVGLLSIALDLPQLVWGVFADSGFTEPFGKAEPRYIYALAVVCPVAAYVFTYAFAANAKARGLVSLSWLLGGSFTAAMTYGGFYFERLLYGHQNAFIATPLVLATAVLIGWSHYSVYVRKEGVSRPAPVGAGGRWWLWALVGGVVLFALFFFLQAGANYVVAEPGPQRRPPRPSAGARSSVQDEVRTSAPAERAENRSGPKE